MNLKKIINPFGGLTYYKETTTSTMSDALEAIESGEPSGDIFLTDFQNDGIGRIPGRKWFASPNENLTFTLILKKDYIGHDFGTTPLRAGLALSKVINKLEEVDAEVKWPNDVVVDGKKISGILCHSMKGYVLIGIGVNVNQLVFDDSLKEKTTSLSLLTGKGFSIEMVLSRFLDEFHRVLQDENWVKELNNLLYRAGEQVAFLVGNPKDDNIVKGTLEGLDDQGRVLIKEESGKISPYLSGEFLK